MSRMFVAAMVGWVIGAVLVCFGFWACETRRQKREWRRIVREAHEADEYWAKREREMK